MSRIPLRLRTFSMIVLPVFDQTPQANAVYPDFPSRLKWIEVMSINEIRARVPSIT